jgi:hypothetical protein
MTPLQYITIVRAAKDLDLARLHFTALLLQAGLDPSRPHRYDDATQTIVPSEPDAPDQG